MALRESLKKAKVKAFTNPDPDPDHVSVRKIYVSSSVLSDNAEIKSHCLTELVSENITD